MKDFGILSFGYYLIPRYLLFDLEMLYCDINITTTQTMQLGVRYE